MPEVGRLDDDLDCVNCVAAGGGESNSANWSYPLSPQINHLQSKTRLKVVCASGSSRNAKKFCQMHN